MGPSEHQPSATVMTYSVGWGLVVGSILFALGACSTTPPPASVQVHCLPLTEYSPEDQKGAASELAGAGPHVRALIHDYEKMRDADRACVAAGGVQ